MAHTIAFHLIRVAKKIQNEIGFKAGGLNLSVSQGSTLLIIDSQKDTSQVDISTKLHLRPASIVSLVDELEKLDLVTRQTISTDRRRYQIILTEKGKAEVKKIRARSNILEKYIRSVLTANQARVLYEALTKLAISLDKIPITLGSQKSLTGKEVKNEIPSPKQYMAS